MSTNTTVYTLLGTAAIPAITSTALSSLVFPAPDFLATAFSGPAPNITLTPLTNPVPTVTAPATYSAIVTVIKSLTSSFDVPVTIYTSPPAEARQTSYPIAAIATFTVAANAAPSASLSSTSSSSSSTGSTASTSSSNPTSSSTSTTTPIPTPSKSSNAGAIAGAAVGCAIGGILIGFLVAFCLFRRKRRQSRTQRSAGMDKEMSPLRGHGEAILLGSGTKAAWMSHLPQAESDGTVRAAASRILDQIEMHIENFYFDKNVMQMTVETQSAIEDFDSPHLPESILKLLPRTDQSTPLLKHCLTNFILSHIDSRNAGVSSFLPKDLTSLKMSPTKTAEPGFAQALSQWRVLTRFLRQDPEHDQTYLGDRDRTIFTAAQNFCRAFDPWARSEENTRVQSLIGIMKRASDLGILLFSQPAAFHWQWENNKSSRKPGATNTAQFVVLPGLYKTTDQEAVALASPLHLLEPRVGSVNGH